MAGVLIVFEGIDGSGKTTAISKAAEAIAKKSKKFDHILITKEPTYKSEAGKNVRQLLQQDGDPRKDAELFMQLYISDRREHLANHINPALQKNYVVLCDRFKHSTMAFQQEQGIPIEKLIKEHEGMTVPDLTIIFDLPAEVAFQRAHGRTDGKETEKKFEHLDFMKKLRENYLKLPILLQKEKIVIINANQTPEKVAEELFSKIGESKVLEKLETLEK